MLHITNGDSVGSALVVGPLPGDVIVWRDVLHEGPVPAELPLAELSRVRARFVFDCGWTESLEDTLDGFASRDAALADSLQEDEVVLWFEHDLFDQLQLLQLLDWFAQQPLGHTRLTLISRAEYLGTLNPRTLAVRFPSRVAVTAAQFAVARAAWAAFRSADPAALTATLATDLSPLPFLRAALVRHLQQFPSSHNGLSRSEQQALLAFESGPTTIAAAFLLSQERDEPAAFLGDATFAWYLTELGAGDTPLIRFVDGAPVTSTTRHTGGAAFWQRDVELTDLGRGVINGSLDRVAVLGLDRWLGGVHLHAPERIWRWNEVEQRLARDD